MEEYDTEDKLIDTVMKEQGTSTEVNNRKI